MLTKLRKSLRKDKDKGATAVEYGLLVALIAAVIVVLVFTLGGRVQAGFQTVCTRLNNNNACAIS
jgi:pilus assembly protein Flp/PilA